MSGKAISESFDTYTKMYPQVQAAINFAMKELIAKRPADPFSFLSEKLREANIFIKVEAIHMRNCAMKIQARARGMRDRQKVARQKETKAKEAAALKIQSRQRGIKAREMGCRSKHRRSNMLVWLYGLFERIRNKQGVESQVLMKYLQCDPDTVQSLDLPRKYYTYPSFFQQNATAAIPVLAETPSKTLDWSDFSALFGLSPEEAEETRKQHAAVQIQATSSISELRETDGEGRCRRFSEDEGREKR
ncbi:hypothetical protein GUITHDRAFT_118364 [Guillardia theta CCMP2712]|uniref:Uncharacterized protein n=1 Tax=Guillardia theta (strain CCMP2712) TaxID=905079 RepID=L1IGU0_GUITC|nr:hypothetical protein GUITHDRAFT_118364 [Guillardia theta CCMP2712]EKX35448.1 hypothetical protein GUITHDRAFT_118364 [Guillardia theta CCMP2712]|eukprot:XP_005822428.1 hypothetical protein GUITHDRAFT_118364 [Guillardia theta CCMP2712]